MNETRKYYGSEIYQHKLMAILLPIFDATSTFTFIFTIFLIIAIITKTPKSMKGFKTFLLPYACYTLLLEIFLGLYCPTMLHPFVYLYPAGFARYFSPNISAIVLTLAFYSAISTIDCCIAMTLERYYAMKNMQSSPSKIPLIAFGFLSFSNFATFVCILVITQVNPICNHFIVPFDAVPFHIAPHIIDLDKVINVNHIIIFTDADINKIPILLLVIVATTSLRVMVAFIFLFINIKTSKKLKQKMSIKSQKNNEMLLRMTYIQLLGFVILLGIPLIAILYVCLLIQEPSFIATYGFFMLNFFGLCDSLATAICIKPYRMFFLNPLKQTFYFKDSRINTQIM